MIRKLSRRLSEARVRRARRPPALGGGIPQGPPTVYYLSPDWPVPSGGIRIIYRHVDLLNENGRSAAVLHHTDGFACRWFEHSTRVVGAPSVRLSPDDVLVVPEIYGPFFDELPREPRLVVFNQNAYATFDRVPAGQPLSYERFTAALTVSPDSAEYLQFAFPGLEVSLVTNPKSILPSSTPLSRRPESESR